MPTIAYRAVRSRRKFVKSLEIKAALGAHLDAVVKRRFLTRFRRVVGDWKHKPQFRARKFITADYVKVNVFPAGPNKRIYEYVTLGTRAHIIRARHAPALAFQLGYKPRTKPVGQYGGMGVATGKLVFAQEVHHPGTVAREFERAIKEDEKAWFSRTMELAWRRAIRSV